ncbi:hypothetical protein CPB86DRAFT_871249 [Serendipita vermifera]|nr:hypothetical protein CPB86DRAFT_871249 [Serendipita vermifera]
MDNPNVQNQQEMQDSSASRQYSQDMAESGVYGTGKATSHPNTQEDEENCIICLHKIIDRTILPACSHDSQCFSCIIEWTKHSSKCPLCLTDIGTHVIHQVRSKNDYKKFFLSLPPSPRHTNQSLDHRRTSFGGRGEASGNSCATGSYSANVRTNFRREEARRLEEFEAAIAKRKYVYMHSLYAKHVATNRYTRYTPHPTPTQISNSRDLQRRATLFLQRELRVWSNLDWKFLTNYIVTLIKMMDLRSEPGIKILSDLLDPAIPYSEEARKPNTEHLAHELYAFLRSPCNHLETYDESVQYDKPSRGTMMRNISSPHVRDMPSTPNSFASKRARARSPSHDGPRTRSRSPPPGLSSPTKRPKRDYRDDGYRYRQSENRSNVGEPSRSERKYELQSPIQKVGTSGPQDASTSREKGEMKRNMSNNDLPPDDLPSSTVALVDMSAEFTPGNRPQTAGLSHHAQATLMQRVRRSLASRNPSGGDTVETLTTSPNEGELRGVTRIERNVEIDQDDVENHGELGSSNNIGCKEQEILMKRLDEQKSRLGSSVQNAAEADDEAADKELEIEFSGPPGGVSGIGLSIRGAARKAKEEREKSLKEMETGLRMQALLHVRLAREKIKMTDNKGDVNKGKICMGNLLQDENEKSSPDEETEPHPPETPMVLSPQKDQQSSPASSPDKAQVNRDLMQRMLRERLLRERLVLARKTAQESTFS